MSEINAGLEKYGEIQQQREQLEKYLEPARALLGTLESTAYLTEVRLPLVVQVLDRLRLWAEIYLKNVKIFPSENIHRKEFDLGTFHEYSVQVLIEFLVEGLTGIMNQQTRQK
jgi:hypothetical protein